MFGRLVKKNSIHHTTINALPPEMLEHVLSFLTNAKDIYAAKSVNSTWSKLLEYKNLNEDAIHYIGLVKDSLKKYCKKNCLSKNELNDYLQACNESIQNNKNNAIVLANNMHRFYRKENKNNDVVTWLIYLFRVSMNTVALSLSYFLLIVFLMENRVKGNENREKNFLDMVKLLHGSRTDTVFMVFSVFMGLTLFVFGAAVFESIDNWGREVDDLDRRYRNTLKFRM